MQQDFPIWKGLFDWSMNFQDGTKPSAACKPEDFTPERRAWLAEALQHYMKDFADRMKEIKEALEATEPDDEAEGANKLKEREALLEELMDIVSSLDQARDLHKIGGLPPLLGLLRCRHPSLRWRAAEVVATCCANNPPVQQWFREGGVLPLLIGLTSDEDGTCRTKALLALSAFVRHSAPCMTVFLASGGLDRVVPMCSDGDARVQRKALTLLQYILSQGGAPVGSRASGLGAIPTLCRILGCPVSNAAVGASGDRSTISDADVGTDTRQAALSALLELARNKGTWDDVKRQAPGLPNTLRGLRDRHEALPAEDRDSEREEGELVEELIRAIGVAPDSSAGNASGNGFNASDHVPIDLTEPNVRDAMAKSSGGSVLGGAMTSEDDKSRFGNGGGAMIVCPRVDKF